VEPLTAARTPFGNFSQPWRAGKVGVDGFGKHETRTQWLASTGDDRFVRAVGDWKFPVCKVANPRAVSGKNGRKTAWILGFTLVEILVVVVIAGIAIAIAVPRLFVSDEERVRQEAQRLLLLVEQVRDRAAFSGYPIAMRLGDDGIVFLERDPTSVAPQWREAQSRDLSPRAWREGVAVELVGAGVGAGTSGSAGESATASHVAFLPSGVGAPFRLRVFVKDAAAKDASAPSVGVAKLERVIEGDALGNVRMLP
jgi:type II secretion system protein H